MIQTALRKDRTDGSQTLLERCSELARPHVDRPLSVLADSELRGRFRHWCGSSGRRYLFSVFPLCGGSASLPRYENAVVLAVLRAPDGARSILWAGHSGGLPDLLFDGEDLEDAMASGANELHMHLLTVDSDARATVVADLAG